MFKQLPYRRTILLLVVLLFSASWQAYAGWAPLLSWTIMILAQLAIMGLLLYGKVYPKNKQASTATANPPTLSEIVQTVNTRTDEVGAPTPRLPAGLRGFVPGVKLSEIASQVRAYSSVDDAKSYGWNFREEIGVFDGAPIFHWALLNDTEWEYEGLTSPAVNPSVPENRRVFGRLYYRQVASVNESATPVVADVNNHSPSPGGSVVGVETTPVPGSM